jgi:aspartate 1-decarboxylase
MSSRTHTKIGLFIAIFIIFFYSFIITFFPISVFEVHAQEKYEYYGYVPAKIWQYNLTDANNVNSGWRLPTSTVASAALIVIIGIKNNTQVDVFNLDNGSLISEAIINSMQRCYAVFKNGTTFKVVTSELTNVLLLNYGSVPPSNATSGPVPVTFYQSTDGAYVGKEFIFMGSGLGYNLDYLILALENAKVTVTRDDGDIQQFSIAANMWEEPIWQPFRIYKVVSTGNIMIQSGRLPDAWGEPRTLCVPSVDGGFMGNTFYSWSQTSWDLTENYGFRVSAAQDTKITVWNLETQQKILTADIQAGSGFGFKPQAPAIVVKSDQPVTLEYIHNGSLENREGTGMYGAYGSGVAYIGVKPDEDTAFYLPVDSYVEAYIFASENTDITIDGNDWTIQANTYFSLSTPGTHIIKANKNVVIEVLNWPFEPEYQGLQYEGVQIPSIQTVDVVPDVSLTPLGESFPITYVIIGVAAAAIGGLVVMQFFKGRRKKIT